MNLKLFPCVAALVLLCFLSCKDDEELSPILEVPQNFKLNLIVDQTIPIDRNVDMLLQDLTSNDSIIYMGKVKRRGGFSISFPKHSYSIDLKEDVSLFDLPPDDDWVLNANFIDKTFIRHSFSYELFRQMNEQNIAPQTEYVELEINGIYNGLYVLMEKLDRSSLKVDKNDPSAVIFKDPPIFREDINLFVPQDIDNFHQQTFPDLDDKNMESYIGYVRQFILSSSDELFNEEVSNYFLMENIIDWHLLILLSNNSDGILKNFYLYRMDSNSPLRIAPWDYDHSFGRDGDNELNLAQRQCRPERSILLKRLLTQDWYKQSLKNRWTELNQNGLFSVSSLKQRLNNFDSAIREKTNINFNLWPLDSQWYYDSNNYEQEVDIFESFIEIRHEQLTKYFNEL